MIKSSNPALNTKTFKSLDKTSDSDQMTLQGTVNKCLIMLALILIPAVYVWHQFYKTKDPSLFIMYMAVGFIGGFIIALITIFYKKASPFTTPIYALLEGTALGSLSAFLEARYPGIVIQAVGLTFGIFLTLLLVYKSRLIKPTENFKLGVTAATGGIFIIYIVSFVLRFFGTEIPYIHGSGLFGIGFSVFVIIIAALNLVMDFDFIEEGAEKGAPKYMEWYASFGLMVTLIWLYIEILNLLSKLRR